MKVVLCYANSIKETTLVMIIFETHTPFASHLVADVGYIGNREDWPDGKWQKIVLGGDEIPRSTSAQLEKDLSFATLGSGKEGKPGLADATVAARCTPRQLAWTGRRLRGRSRGRLLLLRRAVVLLGLVVLLVRHLLDSVKLALLAFDEGCDIALTNHADCTGGYRTLGN
jgi:hypothetical protein